MKMGVKLKTNGFTLIELMMVVLVTLLTVGGVMVNVYNFNKRQGLEDDAYNLVAELRNTYQKALGNYRQPNCVSLLSYKIRGTSAGNSVEIEESCVSGSSANNEKPDFLKSTTFSNSFEVTFLAGSGMTATNISDNKIIITNGSDTRYIQVNNYGDFKITQ